MSPRVAGILAMVAAVALAVFGGSLFANPWTSIPGAIVIVLASILFAIGAVWTLRTSWADKTWPPAVAAPDAAKSLRRLRRSAVVQFLFATWIIGGSVAGMVAGESVWPNVLGVVVGTAILATGIIYLWAANRLRRSGSLSL